jgi:hypothetical protein
MAFSKSFDRELNKLFRRRTYWLRRKLGTSGAGKPPEFGRKRVSVGIRRLKAIASNVLARKLAKSEFDEHTAPRRNYHVKGRGRDEKKAEFEKWFVSRFGKTKGLIYAFWGNHRKCIYVGAYRISRKPTVVSYERRLVLNRQTSDDLSGKGEESYSKIRMPGDP